VKSVVQRFGTFLNEVWQEYALVLTGGTIAALAAIFSFLVDHRLVSLSLWSATASLTATRTALAFGTFLIFVAVFKAWDKQYLKANHLAAEVETVRGRPSLTAHFEHVGTPPRMMLRLHNNSPTPAVNVVIQDIRHGSKVLRFENPDPIRNNVPGPFIRCWILENGIQQRDDVLALFSGSDFLGQNTPIQHLRILFSSVDGSKRSWAFSAFFWYDTLQGRIVTSQQSIESNSDEQGRAIIPSAVD
jgi:hypothetical protein